MLQRIVTTAAVQSTARMQMMNKPSTTTLVVSRQFSKVGSRETIPECPEKVRFGLTGLSILIAPFIYVGGMFSKKAASLLEDYDIFVPEDDDD